MAEDKSVPGTAKVPGIEEGVQTSDLPGGPDVNTGDPDFSAGTVDTPKGASPTKVTTGKDTNLGKGTAPRP